MHISGQKLYSYIFEIPQMSFIFPFNTSHHFLHTLIPQTEYTVNIQTIIDGDEDNTTIFSFSTVEGGMLRLDTSLYHCILFTYKYPHQICTRA